MTPTITCTQAEYDAWRAELDARVGTGDFMAADAMDMNNIFVLAAKLAQLHPRAAARLVEVTPEAVEATATLGTFMGADNLVRLAGLADQVDAKQVMLDLMTAA